jgi:hypothetical protein
MSISIPRWNPGTTTTEPESYLLSRLTRTRKLYAFLRVHRRDLFDDSFQDELESMYRDTGAGKPPCPPALLAMVCLMQGYQRVSDAEAVELTVVDRRWQLVLDRLGDDAPACGQGTLVEFRNRLIRTDLDRRLLERTAALAKKTKGFDPKKLPKTLRVAIDSAPLQGAGRVEDTINLLWHAARKIVEGMALVLESDKETICQQAGIPLLLAPSAKTALDRDWSQPGATQGALELLLDELESLVTWLSFHHGAQMAMPPLSPYVHVLEQVIHQDLEPDPAPDQDELRLRQGGGQRPADLGGGIADAPWAQEQESADRRVQAPHRDGPGERTDPGVRPHTSQPTRGGGCSKPGEGLGRAGAEGG